mmetsp:Transcript_25074/g.32547  ORF Transcript_25074/g.32547 Transcript_25074/m.32547 type:complete len:479 (+) Transcript_25074:102-1538(+)
MSTKNPISSAQLALAAIGAITLLNKSQDIPLVTKILKDNEPNYTRKAVVGSAVIFGFEKVIAKVLQDTGLKLPSSLGSMVSIFVLLKVIQATKGEEEAAKLAESFRPAVNFLGNWMPLFLTPPLVVLPNNLGDVKGGKDWARLVAVHFLGWVVSVSSTVAVAKAISKATKENQESGQQEEKDTSSTPHRASKPSTKKAESPAERRARLLKAWRVITAACYILLPKLGKDPALFSTTILSLIGGQSLPKSVTKVLHPLVVAGAVTSVVSSILGKMEGLSGEDALKSYHKNKGLGDMGPGDSFFALLNASCCALGIRMFYTRKTLEANLPTLLGSTAFSSMLSMFGTTLVAGQVGLPEKVSLMLSQRSVMSSLGIGGANLLGASPALTVASILVTGVYGASIGKDFLEFLGAPPEAPLTRGLVTGATSHSIGTAALMEKEPEATAISSVALCLAGVIHTFVCAVPAVQSALKKMASSVPK